MVIEHSRYFRKIPRAPGLVLVHFGKVVELGHFGTKTALLWLQKGVKQTKATQSRITTFQGEHRELTFTGGGNGPRGDGLTRHGVVKSIAAVGRLALVPL